MIICAYATSIFRVWTLKHNLIVFWLCGVIRWWCFGLVVYWLNGVSGLMVLLSWFMLLAYLLLGYLLLDYLLLGCLLLMMRYV